MKISLDTVQRLAGLHGLEVVAVLPVAGAEDFLSPAIARLGAWQGLGFAGEMGYMARPVALFESVRNLLPSARSVVSFVVPYRSEPGDGVECAPGYGRVARYAWGRDYHRVLKKRLNGFVQSALAEFPLLESRVFSDAVPALERSLAASGCGSFIGKNSMLIRPGTGSFTFICEVIWNLDVAGTDALNAKPALPGIGCKSCSRCVDKCPTDALRGDGMLDSRLCISYLTIEKKTAFDAWEAQAIGEWIFGCDVCQEVCPFNHSGIPRSTIKEFSAESGSGSLLELTRILALDSDEKFLAEFAGTALMRAGRRNLLRNAAAVAANTVALDALPSLSVTAVSDPSEIVRAEAARSISRLKQNSSEGLTGSSVFDCRLILEKAFEL